MLWYFLEQNLDFLIATKVTGIQELVTEKIDHFGSKHGKWYVTDFDENQKSI